MPRSQHTRVIDQFTKMATVFATAAPFTDLQALDLLLARTGASAQDTSLDVACGAGVVACHFATKVAWAVGIDLTPAMIAKARQRQADTGLANLSWDVGDASALPYADARFTIVTSRFAHHHMTDPARALQEMVRVCRPGGSVLVADICLPDDASDQDEFNRIERMNDPSHVRALGESEWLAAFAAVQLLTPSITRYQIDLPLLGLMRASKLSDNACALVDAELRQAIASGQLQGLARIENGQCVFGYPIAVLCARKPLAGQAGC